MKEIKKGTKTAFYKNSKEPEFETHAYYLRKGQISKIDFLADENSVSSSKMIRKLIDIGLKKEFQR